MVSRVYLKLAVKALRFKRHTIPFLKIYKNDIVTKTKDEFLGVFVQNKIKIKIKKTGTWSTSSLIPRREDIIPRWSQLLTPVFNKRNIRPRGGKIILFKYFGLKIIVQR